MAKKQKIQAWTLWAKALGQKATKNDREADYIAGVRSIIFFTYLLTNLFIIAGVIRHWNDSQPIHLYHYEIPSDLHQEQKEGAIKTNRNFLYD